MSEKKNIFIVDDIQENLQVLGNILREKNYNISFARDGRQAINGISKRLPDLILLDVAMPEMDGYEACKELKNTPLTQDIPIIFLTAKTEIDDIVKGFQLGAVDYVTKPFHKEELLARVNTHLELSDARKTIENQMAEIYKISITDKLTQIYNRHFLLESLNKEISKSIRNQRPLSCIIMDIDHFKSVNDTYGHLAGDAVLRETAQKINESLRNEDIFGRYGGEEFLLILPETNEEQARTAGEKIRELVMDNQVIFGEETLKVTISMGLAELQILKAENEDQLINHADEALYEAKKQGRNRLLIKQTT